MPKKGKREMEAFIQLTEETPEQTIWAVRIIERIGGRPLHLYPPGVIIASIPLQHLRTLKANSLIASIDLGEIEEARIGKATAEAAFAMSAWNRHLRRRRLAPSGLTGAPLRRGGKRDKPRRVRRLLPKRNSISSLPEE